MLAPGCQYNQCDQLHVPLAVDVLFVHATIGPRSWIRIDWWRIPGPSRKLHLQPQQSESSSYTIQHRRRGAKKKPPPQGVAQGGAWLIIGISATLTAAEYLGKLLSFEFLAPLFFLHNERIKPSCGIITPTATFLCYPRSGRG